MIWLDALAVRRCVVTFPMRFDSYVSNTSKCVCVYGEVGPLLVAKFAESLQLLSVAGIRSNRSLGMALNICTLFGRVFCITH